MEGDELERRLTEELLSLLRDSSLPWKLELRVIRNEDTGVTKLEFTLRLNTLTGDFSNPPDSRVEEIASSLGWFLEKIGARIYEDLRFCPQCKKILSIRADMSELKLEGHDELGIPVYSHKVCSTRLRTVRGAKILQLYRKISLRNGDPETIKSILRAEMEKFIKLAENLFKDF